MSDQQQHEGVHPRPKRKAIPDKVKLKSILIHGGRCKDCRTAFGELSQIEFDHRPAIVNRIVNAEGTDYIPPQLDPEYIYPRCDNCHDKRTAGPGGEKRITVAGSDIGIRDKTRRLIAKGPPGTKPAKTKPKAKIQGRGFAKREKPQARATGYKRRGA